MVTDDIAGPLTRQVLELLLPYRSLLGCEVARTLRKIICRRCDSGMMRLNI
jgi:hypothetical protein